MEVADFCSTSRVVIVAGKGGVGKTTVTAALAVTAARAGRSVLIVEVEGKSGLPAMFGARARIRGDRSRPGVRARFLTPDAALIDYLVTHGMKRISKRLASSGALDVVATAVPGMKDILVLGKVKSIEESRSADLVIVDAPAAGHAVTFLLSARGLLDAVRVGPIRKQAQDVVSLISDPARCQVMLVTLAEETPVSEVVDTAFAIEDRAGVALGPVVVNGCFTPLPVAVSTDAAAILDDAGVRPLRLGARSRRPRARGRVPRRAPRVAAATDRTAARTAPAPADPAPVRLRPRHHAQSARPARRRVPARDRTTVTAGIPAYRTSSSTIGRSSSAAAPVVSARPRPQPCSRSKARGGAGTCVVTIDPARRLADALGIEHLTNDPTEIDRELWAGPGTPAGGRLSALMLDTKSTFDLLVTRNASSPEQAQRILDNTFYRNVSGALGGTQEYMAMEKLHELHDEGGFDLIVVDTPDAPRARLPRRAAAPHAPPRQPRLPAVDDADARASRSRASRCRRSCARSRVVGSEVIEDVVAFFRAFEGMEEGFRERAPRSSATSSPIPPPRSCSSARPGATRCKRRPSSRSDWPRPANRFRR